MSRIYFIEQDARVIRPDELAKLAEGNTAKSLGEALGVEHTTMLRALKKLGVRPVRHWTEEATDDDA